MDLKINNLSWRLQIQGGVLKIQGDAKKARWSGKIQGGANISMLNLRWCEDFKVKFKVECLCKC